MDLHALFKLLDRLHDRSTKELLVQAGIVKSFETGEELLRTGQYIRYVPIVLKGSLKVTREDDSGREILLYFIRPGESCIMTLFAVRQNHPSLVRAVVDEPVELLLVPVETIHRDLENHRDWLNFTFALFQQRYEELLQMINDIAFARVDDRLIDLLRMRSKMQQNREIAVTHQQLADELGTAREVVTRLLKKLELEGVIETGRGKVRLRGDEAAT